MNIRVLCQFNLHILYSQTSLLYISNMTSVKFLKVDHVYNLVKYLEQIFLFKSNSIFPQGLVYSSVD
jgi:predicted AAA+ superfamily ATPase